MGFHGVLEQNPIQTCGTPRSFFPPGLKKGRLPWMDAIHFAPKKPWNHDLLVNTNLWFHSHGLQVVQVVSEFDFNRRWQTPKFTASTPHLAWEPRGSRGPGTQGSGKARNRRVSAFSGTFFGRLDDSERRFQLHAVHLVGRHAARPAPQVLPPEASRAEGEVPGSSRSALGKNVVLSSWFRKAHMFLLRVPDSGRCQGKLKANSLFVGSHPLSPTWSPFGNTVAGRNPFRTT